MIAEREGRRSRWATVAPEGGCADGGRCLRGADTLRLGVGPWLLTMVRSRPIFGLTRRSLTVASFGVNDATLACFVWLRMRRHFACS